MTTADPFRLDGKVAVITGASRGIGKAIAVAMAKAGADIIGVSTNPSTGPGSVGEEVEAAGRRYTQVAADLSRRSSVYDAVGAIQSLERPVDILVNNAGAIRRNAATVHSDEDWDHILSINLTAPFLLAREFGRGMVERGGGKIIFTASLLSFQGGLNVVSYAASKGGVALLTKALANEWAASGVNVNAIAPGYIRTDVNAALRQDPDREGAIRARIPAGDWGMPDHVAPAAVYLASAAADYVHGEILTIDGGWMGR